MQSVNISVVITTFNRCKLFQRAIESVLAQTYTDYQLYIIDDGSTDGTGQIADVYAQEHAHVHAIRLDQNKGLAHARNMGLEVSHGDYIAFLDDDDQWKPECLQKRVEALASFSDRQIEQLGVVYGGCEIQMPESNSVTYHLPVIQGNIRENIIEHDLSTIPSSGLFRRAALKKAGGFDEQLISSIDHDIWMSLAICGYSAYGSNEPLVVTYEIPRRKAMVTNTSNRIVGVEQYLKKWAPTYQQWFGVSGAKKYERKYRRHVLTRLAVTKIQERQWGDAKTLFSHVTSQGNFLPTEILFISRLLIVHAIKKCCPRVVMNWLRTTKHSRAFKC